MAVALGSVLSKVKGVMFERQMVKEKVVKHGINVTMQANGRRHGGGGSTLD